MLFLFKINFRFGLSIFYYFSFISINKKKVLVNYNSVYLNQTYFLQNTTFTQK